jgi:hypothetical protein
MLACWMVVGSVVVARTKGVVGVVDVVGSVVVGSVVVVVVVVVIVVVVVVGMVVVGAATQATLEDASTFTALPPSAARVAVPCWLKEIYHKTSFRKFKTGDTTSVVFGRTVVSLTRVVVRRRVLRTSPNSVKLLTTAQLLVEP